MPVKFKIYYAFVIYLLLWAVGWLSYMAYMLAKNPVNKSEAVGIVIIGGVLLLCIIKAVSCLTMVRHLKNTTLPGKAGRVFFIILFAVNILFVLLDGAAVWGIVDIILTPVYTDVKSPLPEPRVTTEEWLVLTSVVAAGVAGIFIAVFDLLLLKAVKNNYHDALLSFDVTGTGQ